MLRHCGGDLLIAFAIGCQQDDLWWNLSPSESL
jgi:hypothetical protein